MKQKAILLGMPVVVEEDDGDLDCWSESALVDAVLAVLLWVVPWNGSVMLYEGSYWKALRFWLFGDLTERR